MKGKKPPEERNFKQTQNYCVYGLLCPLAMQIKYIGCTRSLWNRELQHRHGTTIEPMKKNLWIVVLREQGLKPIPVIIKEFADLNDARRFEDEQIRKHHLTLYNRLTTFTGSIKHGRYCEGEKIDNLPDTYQARIGYIFIVINGIKYGYADETTRHKSKIIEPLNKIA